MTGSFSGKLQDLTKSTFFNAERPEPHLSENS